MFKTLLLSLFCFFLVGCKTIEPSITVKEKLVPVTIDKRLLETRDIPKPSMSRSELKTLNEKEFIAWQNNFITELLHHIEKDYVQINGIATALDKANEEIKKGNQ